MPANIVGPIKIYTQYGEFELHYFENNEKQGVVVLNRSQAIQQLLRVQSSCLFSEALKTIDCDCSLQISGSLDLISKQNGCLIYTYDEGRGAGLMNKVRAIQLQQNQEMNTREAFTALGLDGDLRNYGHVKDILHHFYPKKTEFRLITNNPQKVILLEKLGFKICERVPLIRRDNEMISNYLDEKAQCLGHLV